MKSLWTQVPGERDDRGVRRVVRQYRATHMGFFYSYDTKERQTPLLALARRIRIANGRKRNRKVNGPSAVKFRMMQVRLPAAEL